MNNEESSPTEYSNSPDLLATVTKIPITFQLDKLPLTWPSLTAKEQNFLWELLPRCRPIVNALYWMQHHTKTKDEQTLRHRCSSTEEQDTKQPSTPTTTIGGKSLSTG